MSVAISGERTLTCTLKLVRSKYELRAQKLDSFLLHATHCNFSLLVCMRSVLVFEVAIAPAGFSIRDIGKAGFSNPTSCQTSSHCLQFLSAHHNNGRDGPFNSNTNNLIKGIMFHHYFI